MDSSSAAVDVDCRTASKVFNESEPCPLPLPARFDDRSLLSGFECRRSGPVWTHALPVSPPLSLNSSDMHWVVLFRFGPEGNRTGEMGANGVYLCGPKNGLLELDESPFSSGIILLYFFLRITLVLLINT
jgi:hypothetical protein